MLIKKYLNLKDLVNNPSSRPMYASLINTPEMYNQFQKIIEEYRKEHIILLKKYSNLDQNLNDKLVSQKNYDPWDTLERPSNTLWYQIQRKRDKLEERLWVHELILNALIATDELINENVKPQKK
uniref:Uncharacterized protein n=1 Tax=Thuricola similis TaxID=2784598 RepID=A0A7T8G5A6_9CILI|nr:hypothetical protein K4Z05_mgp34 [Thuricola similis]QQP22129.1 hypothetical protein TSIM_15 [Thuricola similis]